MCAPLSPCKKNHCPGCALNRRVRPSPHARRTTPHDAHSPAGIQRFHRPCRLASSFRRSCRQAGGQLGVQGWLPRPPVVCSRAAKAAGLVHTAGPLEQIKACCPAAHSPASPNLACSGWMVQRASDCACAFSAASADTFGRKPCSAAAPAVQLNAAGDKRTHASEAHAHAQESCCIANLGNTPAVTQQQLPDLRGTHAPP